MSPHPYKFLITGERFYTLPEYSHGKLPTHNQKILLGKSETSSHIHDCSDNLPRQLVEFSQTFKGLCQKIFYIPKQSVDI